MNRWLTERDTLIPLAVLLYRLYYAVLLGVLLWTFLRHAKVYLHVRRTFVAMTGLALLVFWALPMSPPRFALAGVVDVIAEHDILTGQPSRNMDNGANHFGHAESSCGMVSLGRLRRVVDDAWLLSTRCAARLAVPAGHGGRRARHGESLRSRRCRQRCAARRGDRARDRVGTPHQSLGGANPQRPNQMWRRSTTKSHEQAPNGLIQRFGLQGLVGGSITGAPP